MASNISEQDIKAGQAVYTSLMLKLYNLWVLDISNRWIWCCSKKKQLKQFNQCVSSNHLDIGVGTGYYLKHCNWPPNSTLSLMDLNPTCLEVARKAIQGIETKTYLADIYKPQSALSNTFNSISLNYLLHCLPGNMHTKSDAISNAVDMLKPGGVLFGATILADEALHTKVSRKLADFYNRKKIFSYQEDTLDALQAMLSSYLDSVEITVCGCVALFKGKKKNELDV
ncbi:class I SAM-dependent methyltransferase [Legionella impletisoli]|uniref:Methyltransferase type 12 domain-containing protein n=1 Tax=Legionella impletisoli TaxID=343510 RepID=A0A917NAC2_9GAMM|nr:class I SAM-dependent methyltransferase [Legionella impletisoli]GGI82261.1 hypothetical protein GCM10007966_08490 [Legionella impletisoli]